MAQMALISHVSYLKFKDEEDRQERESGGPQVKSGGMPARVPSGGRILNKSDKNNAQAYALIAGGILG